MKTKIFPFLLLLCFRDINETSTEEACLELDILSFRTLHCQAANVYGKTILFDGRQMTKDFFFLLHLNLDMVFRNSTPGEFRMYLTR